MVQVELLRNIVLVACGLIVGVRIVSTEDGSVFCPELVGSSGPATTASTVTSVTRNELLLGKRVKGTILDSVVNLSGRSRHESPAGTAGFLIFDGVDNTPISPVNLGSIRGEGLNESFARVHFVLATRGVVKRTVGVDTVRVNFLALSSRRNTLRRV